VNIGSHRFSRPALPLGFQIISVERGAAGEEVVITRRGKAVARLEAPRRVRLGTMRGRIVLKPGWDAPITEEQFLSGDF
jgi:hypothetical protein